MIGTTISHYQITAKLGQGGMGEVYRATDTKLDREVAIKVLPQEICDDPARRKRFLKEAKAASALNHPHVCVIYEVSETDDGRPFIAMEFLPGQTLDLLPANKPLDNETVIEIGSQIADALDAAMQAGIIHRDIKPANIHRDARGRVKVLDFGLAKRTDSAPAADASTAEQTEPGKLLGTPSYMSPEQTRCETLDHRSDLFSLGIVLYELTTGRQPFEGASIAETMEKITRDPPEAIARFNYAVSSELERIIRKCLEKKPDHRYQSARELMIDFKRLQRDSSTQTAALSLKQRSWKAVATVAGVALIICLLLGIWWSRRDTGLSDAFRYGKSVAVLPFRSDEEFQYVSDGLGEELAGGLSRLDSIERVPPFSSSERLKGDALDLESIADQLRVSTLLQGSIRRRAQTLVISAELVEPYSDSLIWQDTYEYDQVTEVPFRIYKEIAQSIAGALDIELSSEQEATLMVAHTSNARAWQAYLEGRYYWAKRGLDLWRAKRLFELALSFDSPTGQEKDSEFALAWVGLADTYTQLANYALIAISEGFPKAIEHAEHALLLNPSLGNAHTTLGFCQTWFQADLSAAMKSFEKAQRLNPQDAGAHYSQIWPLLALGRGPEAIEVCKKACRIDPLSDLALYGLCIAYWVTGDIENGERECRKLALRTSDLWLGHFMLAQALLGKGNPQEAVQKAELAVELSGRTPTALSVLGQTYAAAGRTNDAKVILDELTDRFPTEESDRWIFLIGLLIALGDDDKAIEHVQNVVQQGHLLFGLHVWPQLRPLWKYPRFIELVNQAGIAHYNPETETFEVVEQRRN